MHPPLLAPAPIRAQLREAASAFERATRSRIQAEHHHARALRSAIRAMLREPAPGDGTALAMFLDAAILVTIAATRSATTTSRSPPPSRLCSTSKPHTTRQQHP